MRARKIKATNINKEYKVHASLKGKPVIIVVGASAGGLEAIQLFLGNLPSQIECSVIIAQHLSPTHKSMLAQLLSKETSLTVTEAKHNEKIEKGMVYITPPDHDITIAKGKINLHQVKLGAGPKPSIDRLFASLVSARDSYIIAIILSGTGMDGAEGLKELSKKEAFIIAQDPDTAKYQGMPIAAIETGVVNTILAPDQMGEVIQQILSNPDSLHTPLHEKEFKGNKLNNILKILGNYSGSDFTNYKTSAILRRIKKRMLLLQINTIEDYTSFLEKDSKEQEMLFNYLLIGVTSFYREPLAFQELQKELSNVLDKNIEDDTLRVWVPGCSTGEEAYSIAFILNELIKDKERKREIQIFATDIDLQSLVHARKGEYNLSDIEKLPNLIKDTYFNITGTKASVIKNVKAQILFSRHDLIINPPFLKMDLVSCRNVLMYFNETFQNQIITILHYALKPDGLLFLGKNEKSEILEEIFIPLSNHINLYQKKNVKGKYPVRNKPLNNLNQLEKTLRKEYNEKLFTEKIGQIYSELIKIPYVIINSKYEIEQVSGDLRLYLSMPKGSIQVSLIKMLNAELQTQTLGALSRAKKEHRLIESTPYSFTLYQKVYYVRLHINPFFLQENEDIYYLVAFEQVDVESLPPDENNTDEDTVTSTKIQELEYELITTKEHLQTYIEELETSNEELQSLNEELQSTNEELQSTNEELETATEELQSTHEEISVAYTELKSTNEQLQIKSAELEVTQSRQEALLNNTLQAFILVNNSYEILSFNEKANEIFSLLSGKELEKNKTIIDYFEGYHMEVWIDFCRKAISGETVTGDLEWFDVVGQKHWFTLSFVPVKNNQLIGGFSLGLLDITVIHEERDLIDITNDQAKIGGWSYDVISEKISWSAATYKLHEAPKEFKPSLNNALQFYKEGIDREKIIKVFTKALAEGTPYDEILTIVTYKGNELMARTKGNPIMHEGKCIKVFGTFQDVTNEYSLQKELVASEEKFRSLVANISDIITLVGADGRIMFSSPAVKEILGYEQAELNGVHIFDLVHPEDIPHVAQKFQEGLQKPGSGPVAIYRFKCKNGSYTTLESRGNNQLQNPGIQGVIISSKDVTERITAEKKLAASHQRLIQAFESITVCFIVHDIDGQVKDINSAARQVLGFTTDKYPDCTEINVGKHIFDNKIDYSNIMGRLIKEKSIKEEKVKIKHAEGHEIVVLVNLSIIETPSESFQVQAIFTDITNDYSAQRLTDFSLRMRIASDEEVYSELLTTGLQLSKELLNSEIAYIVFCEHKSFKFNNLHWSLNNNIEPKTLLSNKAFIELVKNDINQCIETRNAIFRNKIGPEINDVHQITVNRTLTLPIIERGVVKAIIGVSNKNFLYTKEDEEQLTTFSHQFWNALQRKKRDEEIKTTNELLQLSQRIAQMGTWSFDLKKGKLTWTDQVYKIFECEREQFGENHPDFLNMIIEEDRERVLNISQRAQKDGNPFVVDYQIITPSGNEKVIEEHGVSERDEYGNIIKLYGTVQDITIRSNEEKRQNLIAKIGLFFNNNESIHLCLKNAIDYITKMGKFEIGEAWILSEDKTKIARVAYTSKDSTTAKFFNVGRQEELTFLPSQGLLGYTWSEKRIILWDNVQNIEYFVRKKEAQQAGMKSAMGLPLLYNEECIGVIVLGSIHKINNLGHFETLFSPIVRTLGIELKRKMLEEELSQIFNTVPDLICISGTDGYFKKINPAGIKMLGYTEKELLSRPFLEFVHPEDIQNTLEETENTNLNKDRGYFENRYITAKGETIWLAWNSKTIPERGLIYAVAKNITEQKKLQELLNSIATISKVGGYEVNFITGEVFISEGANRIFERDLHISPKNFEFLHYVAPEYKMLLEQKLKELYKYNRPIDVQLPIILTNGNEKWISFKGNAEFLKGKCQRIYGSIQDINDSKIIELTIRKNYQSIKDYKLALDKSANIVLTDINGVIIDVNDRTCHLTGYTREELIGQHTRINKSGVHSQEYYAHLWNTITSGEVWRGELYNLKKDGSGYWVDTVIVPLKDENEKILHFLAIRNDITDRKKYIAEIEAQNKKMKDIAWMQSHVVRAPLARLMGLIELLKIEKISQEEIDTIMVSIESSAKELDDIVREIVNQTRIIERF